MSRRAPACSHPRRSTHPSAVHRRSRGSRPTYARRLGVQRPLPASNRLDREPPCTPYPVRAVLAILAQPDQLKARHAFPVPSASNRSASAVAVTPTNRVASDQRRLHAAVMRLLPRTLGVIGIEERQYNGIECARVVHEHVVRRVRDLRTLGRW
jgi:hypothetical protein